MDLCRMPMASIWDGKIEALGTILEVEPKLCFCWNLAWNFIFRDASVHVWKLLANILIKKVKVRFKKVPSKT